MNLDLEDCAFRIDKDLPLATGDLLAAIVAARPAGFGGLHRLTVDDRGARLRVPAARLAIVLAQDLIYSFPFAVFAPLAEIVIYILVQRQIMRHHPPCDATAQYIKASIDDPTQGILRLLPAFLTFGEESGNEVPFLVFQICRIALVLHGSWLPSGQAPAPIQQPTTSDITPIVLSGFGRISTEQPQPS